MHCSRFWYVFLLCLSFSITSAFAGEYTITDSNKTQLVGKYFDILEDPAGKLTIDDVIAQTEFITSDKDVPNFNITKSVFWMKVDLKNQLSVPVLMHLKYAQLDRVEFYKVIDGRVVDKLISGEVVPVNKREYNNQDFIYDPELEQGESAEVYIRIQSEEQILVPVVVGSSNVVYNDIINTDILSAIYFGIIFVMFLYNLFVYFTVRDKSYLYYVIYIVFVGLTQLCFQGHTYRFFWPSFPWFANQSVILFPAITGIAAIEFFKHFLNVKSYSKKFIIVLNLFNVFYIVNCILSITGMHQLSQQLMQPTAGLAAFVILGMAMYIMRKGSRSARFFILAWSVFLAGIMLFIMKDVGIFPYNNLTNYILHIGSTFEVIVLSFALADRINILRKEKEESQQQAFAVLQDNARIISEQNVMLEIKVNERTVELQESNEGLNQALKELKEAESSLVESEKMASLGQLTAGIAHEINNPINFVTSNVKPLRRDIDMVMDVLNNIEQICFAEDLTTEQKKNKIQEYKEDIDFSYLKEEIGFLLKGIQEGSDRTAEIVKGLRVFSRLDEDDLKKADINEGIESTLIIVNNMLENRIVIEKNYGNLPVVECYPGKLNQVILNIITNGLQAIKSRFSGHGGIFTVTTTHDEHNVYISLRDNGIGMDENTKKKVFEPFFTTKDVGEGTGLGMSIAYNTINKHNGKIEINSVLGEGTEFFITIPIIHTE